jgi:hypothetical protein
MLFWRRDAAFGNAWITFVVICVGIALAVIALPAFAAADTASVIAPSNPHEPKVDSGWQAGTCKKEPAITDPNPAAFCNVDSDAAEFFFETAAAHPNFGFTQFIVAHTEEELLGLVKIEAPTNELEYVRVELPVGLSVNPGATGRCPIEVFEAKASNCESYGARVGESGVTASALGIAQFPPIPGITAVPVYNLVPKQGQAARFGLELLENEVFLEGDIASTTDYHEGFTIKVPKALPVEGLPALILKNRLVFNGKAHTADGNGAFLTTPSTCHGQAFTESCSEFSTLLKSASY